VNIEEALKVLLWLTGKEVAEGLQREARQSVYHDEVQEIQSKDLGYTIKLGTDDDESE
jgi:hypothetical protein